MKTGGCIIVIVGVLFTTQTPVSLDSMIKCVRLRMNVFSVHCKTLYLLLRKKKFTQSLQETLCVWSKQPRTIKTIIYNNILTSSRRKKVQSPAKQYKELFSLRQNHFR